MKKLLLSLALAGLSLAGNADNFSIHNVGSVAYDVGYSMIAKNPNSIIQYYYLFPSHGGAYHTINASTTWTFSITPPTGWTIDYSTAGVSVNIPYCSSTFGFSMNSPSNQTHNDNPYGCGFCYQTWFDINSTGDFNIYDNTIVGCREASASTDVQGKTNDQTSTERTSAQANEAPTQTSVGFDGSNIFTDNVSIVYALADNTANTTLTIMDANGRIVSKENLGTKALGKYTYVFDGSALAPGMYFVILDADDHRETVKMLKQ